ncbi:hydroxymethylbilane synthase [Naasia lichenicola]|uniref:Hydroxymethylbilane synthase n=1 Tax=Naasia lichenicola TaxID=2565933 RepID=A0A4S4FJA7_9MICO|nr:hydroxymethylbilane synthase [Naasia lichenicola]
MGRLRIGTRRSALALAQAGMIADTLRAAGNEVELVPIASEGDVNQASLSVIGGRGVFAGTLRSALLRGDCDLVVHSFKDLPTTPFDGLSVLGVPTREDQRDVLCARDGMTLAELPAGSRVGTGSPRRIAQLRAHRPDLDVVDLRGNVDTRLGMILDGRLDAVVLAAAGVARLGRDSAVTERFGLEDWPTAPAQGALAIEVRSADAAHRLPPFPDPTEIGEAVDALTDLESAYEVEAERGVLRGLEAGCTAPIGVSAVARAGSLDVVASVYRIDGTESIVRTGRAAYDADDPTSLLGAAQSISAQLVAELLDGGAAELAPLGVSA